MGCIMNRKECIETILTEHFRPIYLEVRDDSHSHAGHSGARTGGETHYEVVIKAEYFKGMSKIQRHQAIYAALADEFKTGLHALAIRADAPGE